jgi:type VI secretion system protein VasD
VTPFLSVSAAPARRGRLVAAFVPLVAAVGCASSPPPPTVAELKITATQDVNPTASGQGAPVMLRVYELSSPSGFEKAEFFPLLNADAKTLGADMVKRHEYLLAPGTTKQESLTAPDQVQALGLFAAYRDITHATWRKTVSLPPHKTTPVTVSASASGLNVAGSP